MRCKVLTLTQPWATLVAIGAKKIETRSWATSYRGPLAIHAAKGLGPVGGKAGLYELCMRKLFFSALDVAGYKTGLDLPLGAIVATCEIVGCESIGYEWPDTLQIAYTGQWGRAYSGHRLTTQERAFGDYSPGRFAWLLGNVQALPEPIPAKGALGLWDWQPEGAM
jgi:hypothetical protein